MYITDRQPEGQYLIDLANFETVSAANLVALGLDAADKLAIENAVDDLSDAINAATAARLAAEAATAAKDAQLTATRNLINQYAKEFRANMSIPNSLLAQLNVAAHEVTPVLSNPVTPTELTATANGEGETLLKWKRNGNTSTTIFEIEYRSSHTADWTLYASTTKSRFSTTLTPGVYAGFRVCAVRRGIKSGYCAPCALWDSTEPVELQVAA